VTALNFTNAQLGPALAEAMAVVLINNGAGALRTLVLDGNLLAQVTQSPPRPLAWSHGAEFAGGSASAGSERLYRPAWSSPVPV
jgi:hypothetical protein